MQQSSQTAWTRGEGQTLTGNSWKSRYNTFNEWLRGSLGVLCSFAEGKVEAKRKALGRLWRMEENAGTSLEERTVPGSLSRMITE